MVNTSSKGPYLTKSLLKERNQPLMADWPFLVIFLEIKAILV